MSEFIIPEKEQHLAEIIRQLLKDKDLESATWSFQQNINSLTNLELTKVAQLMDSEGHNFYTDPLLKEFIFEVVEKDLLIENQKGYEPGHPINTYLLENEIFGQTIFEIRQVIIGAAPESKLPSLWKDLEKINIHYLRKENQLFPYLEKKGFSHPSTVMWQYQDDIRAAVKTVAQGLEEKQTLKDLAHKIDVATAMIEDLMQREESILFPKASSLLNDHDWQEIRRGEEEIGYAIIQAPPMWPNEATQPVQKKEEQVAEQKASPEETYTHPSELKTASEALPFSTDGCIRLDEGFLNEEQLCLLFQFLPLDITFVDEHDRVRFYNKGEDRVFPRSPGIIGREVKYCHPPKSVDTVIEILDAFKEGRENKAEFWLQFQERFIFISYFAIRDKDNNYKGVLEVSQDVTGIRKLEGEQRLLTWS